MNRAAAVIRRRTTINTYTVRTSVPGTFFVYPSVIDERRTEQKPMGDAEAIGRNISTQTQDDFGNVISFSSELYPMVAGQAAGIPTRSAVSATYDNFVPSWLIGLNRSIIRTSTTPDGQTHSRTIEHDFMPNTGLISKIRIDPQSQTDFGNQCVRVLSRKDFWVQRIRFNNIR